ncbi:MAG TPA: thiamine phosphate synthase [Candidatus Angelobacter sp.]|nr:thiamine phosphate synthase [Candidatus Angelobacter sp.]
MSTTRKEPREAAVLLCYITNRSQFPGNPNDRDRLLLAKIAECVRAGVDWVQLREKDLSARELEELACKAVAAIGSGSRTSLLINSRIDVALAAGAHGVHLPARDLSPSDARVIWDRAGKTGAVIGVSAHTVDEVSQAEAHGADFAVFAPVFEKSGVANPVGMEQLWQACHRPHPAGAVMPVLALGGVTLSNAQRCLDAGAAGIAGIRLFQENDVESTVQGLRSMRV